MISLDDYGFGTIHAGRSNRDVAAQWMFEGTLPLTLRLFSLFFSFDGETLRVTVSAGLVGRRAA